MASKGDGIDLLSDAPPMGFLANLLCNMAGIDLGENPAVEEFRATILGFYVRTDDGEEFYIQAVRCGHVLEFVPNLSSKSFICVSCGEYYRKDQESPDRNSICVSCAEGQVTCDVCGLHFNPKDGGSVREESVRKGDGFKICDACYTSGGKKVKL